MRWFLNGKLNITENALDRHLAQRGDQTAILWEPNDPSDKATSITYRGALSQRLSFCQCPQKNGIQKGDRVVLYMPMIPELAIACLACARIGAVHSVVFAGFSAKAMADRINDAEAENGDYSR